MDISTKEPTSADILIMNADKALYMAKAEGRGTFRFFEPEMNAHTQSPHRHERYLWRAVEKACVA